VSHPPLALERGYDPVLGLIVRRDRRGTGLGRLLLGHLERWASEHGHEHLWVATGEPAVKFYKRCGWQVRETVPREFELATVLTKQTPRHDLC
jgi:GNAT superfamily N-acetyltransferase